MRQRRGRRPTLRRVSRAERTTKPRNVASQIGRRTLSRWQQASRRALLDELVGSERTLTSALGRRVGRSVLEVADNPDTAWQVGGNLAGEILGLLLQQGVSNVFGVRSNTQNFGLSAAQQQADQWQTLARGQRVR